MFNAKWRAALAGAAICGLLGPGIALLLLYIQLLRPSSFRGAAGIAVIVVRLWILAFLWVGLAALVFGSVAGLLVHSVERRYRAVRVAILQAGLLGLALGIAVPTVTTFVTWVCLRKDDRYNFIRDVSGQLPVAALTGVICALLLLWLFRVTSGTDRLRPELFINPHFTH
jgi:hypothetical protein